MYVYVWYMRYLFINGYFVYKKHPIGTFSNANMYTSIGLKHILQLP